MSKEAQSSLDNLWIFKFGFIPYLKIIQIFLTKLIRATLTKALLKVLSYGRCHFFQSSWASFCPGALLAESTDQYSFIISLVEGFLVTIVSSECGWGNSDDCLWEEGEEVSFKESIFEILYVLLFSWRFIFFFRSRIKGLPTATEAEVKQVISAQLKYAPDRAHGGGRGNDGRVTERSWNGSGTSNP